jgi:hypothetical protein
LTIVVSRIDMTAPSIATPLMIQTRRSILSEGAGAEREVAMDRMVPNDQVPVN